MDAKERVLKSINYEEPDRVPSFEIPIDNLKVYEHYGLKYGPPASKNDKPRAASPVNIFAKVEGDSTSSLCYIIRLFLNYIFLLHNITLRRV